MNTARVLMLCTVAALGACHKDSGAPPPPTPAPHIAVPAAVKKGPGAAELTAGMVEAASQGKSQLPIQLKFDLKQRPALGRALDIDIAVMPQIDASPANVQVSGGDGLNVAPGTGQIDWPAIEAGQVYRHSVQVTPTVDGLLLLSLTVSLKHDETTESRVFSIPLIVER
ncbi:MAG TPA: hypothetical protein VNZ53_24070 [Steroidobacteraceae bacterium]|jgi:hypothetical protein|nr:hypothetical protein [Steroidobacteraceae bacterium]